MSVTFQKEASQCEELHARAHESQENIQLIQQQYLEKTDQINAMLLEKHKNEVG